MFKELATVFCMFTIVDKVFVSSNTVQKTQIKFGLLRKLAKKDWIMEVLTFLDGNIQ